MSRQRGSGPTYSRIGGGVGRQGVGIPKENPKQVQAQKDGKIPYEYLVLSVLEDDAYVHKHGGDKYGKNNWQIDEIRASTYVGAMFRHYKSWCDGEDLDPDSKRPHLTHLRACCAVVMDAIKHDKLIDDRLYAESLEPDEQQDPACTCGGAPHDDNCDIMRTCKCDQCIAKRKAEVENCMFCEDAICDTCAPIYKVAKAVPDWAVPLVKENWVVIENLEAGMLRSYGMFPSKDAAKSYAIIVRRACSKKHFVSVMQVNNVRLS